MAARALPLILVSQYRSGEIYQPVRLCLRSMSCSQQAASSYVSQILPDQSRRIHVKHSPSLGKPTDPRWPRPQTNDFYREILRKGPK